MINFESNSPKVMTSIFLDADSSFLDRNHPSSSSSSQTSSVAVAFSQSLLNSIAHAAAAVAASSSSITSSSITSSATSSSLSSVGSLVQTYNWYYDKSEFRRVPSIIDGISYERERRYRNDGARFILNVGSQMKLRYTTLATGVVYFHRFYMFHSFNVFPRYVTAACCLFLAGKAEETPKKCKDIIKIARTLLTDQQFATFGEDPKEEVITMERIVLQTIRFDLQVEHPYKFLVSYAKSFKGNKEKIHNVLQMAWTFTNDSLCTTINLQWEPEIVAIAMLFLASKIKYEINDWEGRLPNHKHWWDMYVEDLSVELLEDVCHQVLDLYQRPQIHRPMDSPQHSPGIPGVPGVSINNLQHPMLNNNNNNHVGGNNPNLINNNSDGFPSLSLPGGAGAAVASMGTAAVPLPPVSGQPPPPLTTTTGTVGPLTGAATTTTGSNVVPNVVLSSNPSGNPMFHNNNNNGNVSAAQSFHQQQQQNSRFDPNSNSMNSLPPPPPPPIPPQWDPNIASFYQQQQHHHQQQQQQQGFNFPFQGGPGSRLGAPPPPPDGVQILPPVPPLPPAILGMQQHQQQQHHLRYPPSQQSNQLQLHHHQPPPPPHHHQQQQQPPLPHHPHPHHPHHHQQQHHMAHLPPPPQPPMMPNLSLQSYLPNNNQRN